MKDLGKTASETQESIYTKREPVEAKTVVSVQKQCPLRKIGQFLNKVCEKLPKKITVIKGVALLLAAVYYDVLREELRGASNALVVYTNSATTSLLSQIKSSICGYCSAQS